MCWIFNMPISATSRFSRAIIYAIHCCARHGARMFTPRHCPAIALTAPASARHQFFKHARLGASLYCRFLAFTTFTSILDIFPRHWFVEDTLLDYYYFIGGLTARRRIQASFLSHIEKQNASATRKKMLQKHWSSSPPSVGSYIAYALIWLTF